MKCYYGNVVRVLINDLKIRKPAFRKIFTVKFFQIFKIVLNIKNYKTANF